MTDQTNETRAPLELRLHEDLQQRFTYHPPAEGQPAAYELIRDLAHRMALVVVLLAHDSRERSLALTKLEETVMHTNSAIARHGLRHDGLDAQEVQQAATDVLRTTKPDSPVAAFCPSGWSHFEEQAVDLEPSPAQVNAEGYAWAAADAAQEPDPVVVVVNGTTIVLQPGDRLEVTSTPTGVTLTR